MATTVTGSITAADIVSASAVGALGQSLVTGTPTANSSVPAAADDDATVLVTLSGTWAATLVFEKSVDDGTTWVAAGLVTAGSKTSGATGATANGSWEGSLGGNAGFRVRCTAFTSGTVSVVVVTGDAAPRLYNGTDYDDQRNNHGVTGLASAARTASVNTADLVNYNARGAKVVIDATASAATPSVVFTIKGKDPLSGKYFTILASAAITGTGTTVLTVYPGVTAAANVSVSDVLPRVWRVEAVAGDADSLTYSVGVNYIL